MTVAYAHGLYDDSMQAGAFAAMIYRNGVLTDISSGTEIPCTPDRIGLTAVVEAAEMLAPDEKAVIMTTSDYAYGSLTRKDDRRKNRDLVHRFNGRTEGKATVRMIKTSKRLYALRSEVRRQMKLIQESYEPPVSPWLG